MRQIVLDTETTGLETDQGHRIIEIGAVELIDRKRSGAQFHKYINPEREIDEGALQVHGLTREFLNDKPTFAEVCEELIEFIRGADLIIHNAPFDTQFLDEEFAKVADVELRVEDLCRVEDSLALARRRHPGQKNSLDALCRRYNVDNTARKLHGALLDAEILVDVYLAMTGGQMGMFANPQGTELQGVASQEEFPPLPNDRPRLRVIRATPEELAEHEAMLKRLGEKCVWTRIQPNQ